jgi:heat shock protein HslJ
MMSTMKRSFALVTVLALTGSLALTACGDDDSSDGGTSVAAEDLNGKTFASTSVSGHELVTDTVVTLSFEDGTVGANAGCNSLSGGFTIEGGALTIGVLASTMMACDEALTAQDEWLSAFLSDDPAIGLDGDVLTLEEGDVTVTLSAQG